LEKEERMRNAGDFQNIFDISKNKIYKIQQEEKK